MQVCLYDGMTDDDSLRALANGTRRAIVRLTRDRDWPVGELATELGVSQPAISQHLAVLRDAGLVSATVDGRRRLYRADTGAIARAGRFFAEYWDDALDRLATAAEAIDASDEHRAAS